MKTSSQRVRRRKGDLVSIPLEGSRQDTTQRIGVSMKALARLLDATVDAETDAAWFMKHTPWLGVDAYLHTVFKPSAGFRLQSCCRSLPPEYLATLERFNGLALFRVRYQSVVSFFGVPPVGPIRRGAGLAGERPYDVFDHNSSWSPGHPLVIGMYHGDGSRVVLNSGLRRMSSAGKFVEGRWASIEDWLGQEIDRLKVHFSKEGRYLLASSKDALP